MPEYDPRAVSDSLAALLRLVRAGDLTASETTVLRLEGAYLALVALSEGRIPDLSELELPTALHESDG